MITEQAIKAKLRNQSIDIQVVESVSSTNTYAAALAGSTNTTTAVIARAQTAGKGTRGRAFFCKEGEGLYLSVLFFPRDDIKTAHLATPAAGVAVAQALETVAHVDADIKWVNDVFVGGKKICGILAESKIAANNEQLDYLVVGIGVNLRVGAFPPELEKTATSLDRHCANVDDNALCAAIIDTLYGYLSDLESRAFMGEYKKRSCVIGRCVLFESGGITVTGKAIDINRDGNLVVEVDNKHYIIGAGDVAIKVI